MRIRPDTQDQGVYRDVVLENEYRLPPRIDDPVVDCGAHVGCFVYACLQRGAPKIKAYEPDRDNYAVLQRNFGHCANVELFNKAVWRSDLSEPVFCFRPHIPRLTAMTVVHPGQFRPPAALYNWPLDWQALGQVDAVGLDDIIESFNEPIGLLKLDCEGSELPILATSRKLNRVRRIVGEWAAAYAPLYEGPWTNDCHAILDAAGFDVEHGSPFGTIGNQLFWATNRMAEA